MQMSIPRGHLNPCFTFNTYNLEICKAMLSLFSGPDDIVMVGQDHPSNASCKRGIFTTFSIVVLI